MSPTTKEAEEILHSMKIIPPQKVGEDLRNLYSEIFGSKSNQDIYVGTPLDAQHFLAGIRESSEPISVMIGCPEDQRNYHLVMSVDLEKMMKADGDLILESRVAEFGSRMIQNVMKELTGIRLTEKQTTTIFKMVRDATVTNRPPFRYDPHSTQLCCELTADCTGLELAINSLGDDSDIVHGKLDRWSDKLVMREVTIAEDLTLADLTKRELHSFKKGKMTIPLSGKYDGEPVQVTQENKYFMQAGTQEKTMAMYFLKKLVKTSATVQSLIEQSEYSKVERLCYDMLDDEHFNRLITDSFRHDYPQGTLMHDIKNTFNIMTRELADTCKAISAYPDDCECDRDLIALKYSEQQRVEHAKVAMQLIVDPMLTNLGMEEEFLFNNSEVFYRSTDKEPPKVRV